MVCLCISEVFHNRFRTKTSKTVLFRKINCGLFTFLFLHIWEYIVHIFTLYSCTVFIKYTYAIRIWGLVIFFSLENNFFCLAEVAELAVAEVAEAETEKSHKEKYVKMASFSGVKLSCPVCAKDYTETGENVAKLLPCIHTVCGYCAFPVFRKEFNLSSL